MRVFVRERDDGQWEAIPEGQTEAEQQGETRGEAVRHAALVLLKGKGGVIAVLKKGADIPTGEDDVDVVQERRFLVAKFDITDLDNDEVDGLAGEVSAQADRSENHSSVEYEIRLQGDEK